MSDFRLTPGWHVPRITFGPARIAPFGGAALRSPMAAAPERVEKVERIDKERDERNEKERFKAVELAVGQIEKRLRYGVEGA